LAPNCFQYTTIASLKWLGHCLVLGRIQFDGPGKELEYPSSSQSFNVLFRSATVQPQLICIIRVPNLLLHWSYTWLQAFSPLVTKWGGSNPPPPKYSLQCWWHSPGLQAICRAIRYPKFLQKGFMMFPHLFPVVQIPKSRVEEPELIKDITIGRFALEFMTGDPFLWNKPTPEGFLTSENKFCARSRQ